MFADYLSRREVMSVVYTLPLEARYSISAFIYYEFIQVLKKETIKDASGDYNTTTGPMWQPE